MFVLCAENGSSSPYKTLESITCDLSAFPECEFFKVEGIIRPWRLSAVVSALDTMGIRGITVTEVKGAGVQGGG